MSRFLKRLLTPSSQAERTAPGEALPAAASEGEEPAAYESQAFALWWQRITEAGGGRLLDLGTLRSSTLSFFADHGLELGVVGLDPADPEPGFARFEAGGTYDGALAWDLANHLDEGRLAALGSWLAGRLGPGAPVFVALATRAPFAERPLRYEVVDASHLRIQAEGRGVAGQALISGPRLARLWPAFETERSFLLRNGMQEYVLRRASGA